MENIKSLKNNYISINGSFGGSQLYFSNIKAPFCKAKKAAGCGIVAMGDVLAYLKSQNTFSSRESYIKYFNKIARKILWIPNRFGLTFLRETLGMAHHLKAESLPFKCRWCFSTSKLLPRIERMLDEDTPIIMCIPRTFGSKKDRLPFYNREPVKVTSTCGHFVVVTGISVYQNEIYLEISSWGNKYYINLDEYIEFQKHHIMGLLGNILLISPKK